MNESPDQNPVSPSMPSELNATPSAPSVPPPLPSRPVAASGVSSPLPKKVVILLCAAVAAVVILLIVLLVVLLLPSTKESPATVVTVSEPPVSAPSAQKVQDAAQPGKDRPPLTRREAVQGVIDVLTEFAKCGPETDDMAGMVKWFENQVAVVTRFLAIPELPAVFRGGLDFLRMQFDFGFQTLRPYRNRSFESLQDDNKFKDDLWSSFAYVHAAIKDLCAYANEEGTDTTELINLYNECLNDLQKALLGDDQAEQSLPPASGAAASAPAVLQNLAPTIPAVDTNNLYYLYSTGQKNAPLSVGEDIDENTGLIFRRDGRPLSGRAQTWNSQMTRTSRMLGGISLLEYQNQLFVNPAKVR